MALIGMAVYDTLENKRTDLTWKTLSSLLDTVDFFRHRLIIVDNGSCHKTIDVYDNFRKRYARAGWASAFKVVFLDDNIGTAKAINKAWLHRNEGEHCVKMDNDVVIHQVGWLDILLECLERDTTIGIIGLKRPDCIETPWHEDPWYRSSLRMLPHETGQRWLIVEEVNHVMGTCQLYNSALLDKIGYLYQMGELYGFDDALASIRAHVVDFKTVMYPHILIDHIDPGGTKFTDWKVREGARLMKQFQAQKELYQKKLIPVYHGPEDE